MQREPLWQRLVVLGATLGIVAGMMWAEMPPWERQMIVRSARLRLRRMTSRLARATGHRAMGRELAGTPEDEAGYGLPYRLSKMRDAL